LNFKRKLSSKENHLNPPQRTYPLNKGTSLQWNPQTHPEFLILTLQNHPLIPLRKGDVTSVKDLGILLRIAQTEKPSPWWSTKHLRKLK